MKIERFLRERLHPYSIFTDNSQPSMQTSEKPQLAKVLGKRDLILLFVAAVANLNIVPEIAAPGQLTI